MGFVPEICGFWLYLETRTALRDKQVSGIKNEDWKDVLTQTAFLCPLHSDQKNWGEGGMVLRTLCISSGSDFRCPISMCWRGAGRAATHSLTARRLFSRYLRSEEIVLAVWDGRSDSWWVEQLGWGGFSSWCAEWLKWGALCWRERFLSKEEW